MCMVIVETDIILLYIQLTVRNFFYHLIIIIYILPYFGTFFALKQCTHTHKKIIIIDDIVLYGIIIYIYIYIQC